MDYDDSFRSAPVRYAVEDVNSDEELEVDFQEKTVKIEVEALPTDITLFLGPAGPGQVYIDSLPNLKESGKITCVVKDIEETKATIYRSASNPTLLISFLQEIPAEETLLYTKSIFNQFKGKIFRVIVLDSFAHNNDLTPPTLRVLQSTNAPVLKDLAQYEIPHMVTGLPAAILNYCEINYKTCYNLLTLQEYVYGKLLVTEETLIAYNEGLKKLGFDLQFDSELLQKALNHKNHIDDSHHRLYI